MKISITTNGFLRSRNCKCSVPLIEAVKKAHEVGFDCLDIGWCSHNDSNYILAQDNWEELVDEIAEYGIKNNIEFYQSHTPFIEACSMTYDNHFKDESYLSYYRELLRRSVIASSKLGVKWQVIHPNTYPEVNFEQEASRKLNHEFYDEYIELGEKLGVGSLYENMLPFLLREHPTRYCQHYDELIALVDSYKNSNVGICFDTGHANQGGLEIGRAIRSCGQRIKALHISDNKYGSVDEHVAPFMGTINWDAFVKALIDIDYKGSLNYETHKMLYDLPYGDVQTVFGKFVHSNAKMLLSMYEKASGNSK